VYVAPEDFDRLVASLLATFGGKSSKQGVFTVTPTSSQTMSQLVLTPVGTLSVFGFKTPIPYPFGIERTGYLVEDLDAAVDAAKSLGADLEVEPFADPIGRDAIVEWPGGIHMQLYWHTQRPSYDKLETIPENRVYVSQYQAKAFVRAFTKFSRGRITLDEPNAPGDEIGRPGEIFHEIHLESQFGKIVVLVSDGHLPYPYGRELFGYQVKDLPRTIQKAQASGATVLIQPHNVGSRNEAMIQFPGGYIAELHALSDH
jgi:predicted enzyme related to lactoylglutathione lyase